MSTQAIEDYAKAIYDLTRDADAVGTSALAERLDVAPASVTGMLKKLAAMNLIVYERYHGAALTEAGRKLAVEVIRHHRLVEAYLHQALGV
ncbi:MAG: metal-dependent transcriptional regulator, partial [Bacteroidota bacterium]